MVVNPRAFIQSAELGTLDPADIELGEVETETAALNLDKLPDGVVSGTTLIDFSAVPSMAVRAGVSLSMLFASRVATKAMKQEDDEDDWLASYTSNLGQLGFSLAGSAIINSKFRKTGLRVHKAIIPFLTVAFGGAAVGPIILAGLRNLQEADAGSPWIKLLDRETRRFKARELHFAAVSSNETDTSIRYAIARLNVDLNETNILFFKLTEAEAHFESSTTTMSANNSLLAAMEVDLRIRLGALTKAHIASAEL
ncbi:hypothetical protein [Mesorhizobium escarrei]|uniref:Uncharacterized protein n=1 Tax=Mesorhizobium escarrei TaxID=666018 RepID=A0ABM9E124_9HYPH|nr:hypothetical protein [Mesorhizobium escarrei]CAH2402763.1 conserved hypothetical protein [Mesorhizobium escarrei]